MFCFHELHFLSLYDWGYGKTLLFWYPDIVKVLHWQDTKRENMLLTCAVLTSFTV